MKCLLPLAMLLLIPIVRGQNLPGTKLKIKKSHGEILLDGVLNEKAWEEADVAENWYQNFPVDATGENRGQSISTETISIVLTLMPKTASFLCFHSV